MNKKNELVIRIFDVSASLLTLVLLLPLLAVISLWIRLDSAGPILFQQKRLGQKGAVFTIYKFRTMINGAENMGMKLLTSRDDDRITRPGKLLRISSMDELPQLINVVRGEMSLVGPRPALIEHLDQYTPRQKRRLEIKPGLTGIAQIRGRNNLSWPDRIELDLEYLTKRSFKENLLIIIHTIPVLFNKDFIYGSPANFEFAPTKNESPAAENTSSYKQYEMVE